MRFLILAAAVFLVGPLASHAQTQPLNDTGITWSGDALDGNATTCEAGTNPDHPEGQDCQYGRDQAARDGELIKIGASTPNNGVENGFDYTKISNTGNDLPASAQLDSGPNDWACTRDNVTGLVWEVKTDDGGLRDQGHTYTWYDSNSPDGNPGKEDEGDGDSCHASGRCDTEKFIEDVNNEGLCGHSDWRLPSRKELLSIVDSGRYNPSIDPDYFPNTPSSDFWSASPDASHSGFAWHVHFSYGNSSSGGNRSLNRRVRAVRGGQ